MVHGELGGDQLGQLHERGGKGLSFVTCQFHVLALCTTGPLAARPVTPSPAALCLSSSLHECVCVCLYVCFYMCVSMRVCKCVYVCKRA